MTFERSTKCYIACASTASQTVDVGSEQPIVRKTSGRASGITVLRLSPK
jgi:hypothetical protein